MLARFALNFVIYLVFGGGIFAFVAVRAATDAAARSELAPGGAQLSTVILSALALAVWSGGLTTVIEKVVVKMDKLVPRALFAAALGALSLGGFAVVMSWVAWRSLPLSFVGLGLAAGALMHGARAFSKGQRPEDIDPEPSDAADGDDDVDGGGPDGGGGERKAA